MLIEKAEGGMNKYYLLEILNDSLAGYSIKKRVKNYIDQYFSNSWEDATGADFPTSAFDLRNLANGDGGQKNGL